jgi:hypothetical protein
MTSGRPFGREKRRRERRGIVREQGLLDLHWE